MTFGVVVAMCSKLEVVSFIQEQTSNYNYMFPKVSKVSDACVSVSI
jgi:hypothetical protein